MSDAMPQTINGPVLIAAGGTGGHMFPAQALAEELASRKIGALLITDSRGIRFGDAFPGTAIHVIASATLSFGNPWHMLCALVRIIQGIAQSLQLIRQHRPSIVIGFGGYPSLAPLVAGWLRRVPLCVHEQNAVLGRVNRALARIIKIIAVSFADTRRVKKSASRKIIVTGNPVRKKVLEAAQTPYPAGEETLRLLIFGGSQGARILSDVVPEALARLSPDQKQNLQITQQVHEADRDRLIRTYQQASITVQTRDFFTDLPDQIARAHLVIARAGASTVAELALIGRPAILVPLAISLDNDQKANAETLSRVDGGWIMEEHLFTADRLTIFLAALIEDRSYLERAARNAKKCGHPKATEKLADIVIRLAQNQPVKNGIENLSTDNQQTGSASSERENLL